MAGRSDIQASAGIDLKDFEAQITTLVQRVDSIEGHAAKASEGIKKIGESVGVASKAVETFKSVLGALGVGLGLGAILNAGKNILTFGADIKDSSAIAQLSTTQFQRLRAELGRFIDVKDAEKTIQGVAASLRDARNENPETIEQFKNLGITWRELSNPATDARTIIESLSSSYTQAGDKTEWLRLATNMFGTEFLKLVPALQQGGDALHQIGEDANVASSELVDAAKQGQIAWDSFLVSVKTKALDAVAGVHNISNAWKNVATQGNQTPQEREAYTHPKLDPDIQEIFESDADFKERQAQNRNTSRFASHPIPIVGTDDSANPIDQSPLKPKSLQDILNPFGSVSNSPVDPNADENRSENLLSIQGELSDKEAKRTVQLQSQIDLLKAEEESYRAQAKIQEQLGKHQEAQASLIKANAAFISRDTLAFQANQEQKIAEIQLDALDARLNGEDRLSKILEVQAKWEDKIAQARREGKNDLAATYTTAMNLQLLQVDVALYAMTPAQRAAMHRQENRDRRLRDKAQTNRDKATGFIGPKQPGSENYGAYGYESTIRDFNQRTPRWDGPPAQPPVIQTLQVGVVQAGVIQPK